MAKITITIPDEHTDLVLEMLRKASGKTINLSCDLVEPNGTIEYDWQEDSETDLAFAQRAIRSVLLGIVKWGVVVKETNRYKQDLRDKQDEVTPITVNVSDDIIG